MFTGNDRHYGNKLAGSHSFFGIYFIGCILFLASTSLHATTLADTVDRIKPSIVAVGTYQPKRAPAAIFRGTGFIVGDGNYILTNAHVLPDVLDFKNREVLALFYWKDGKAKYSSLQKVAVDREHDVALLRFSGGPLKALKLAESKRVREGELYAFTGFPLGMVLGLHPVTHRGIVSAISPVVIPVHNSRHLNPEMIRRLKRPYKVFQLDATAYPGNSGSPLYDVETGAVIGVINKVFVKESKESVIQKPSGISYAIPIKYAQKLLAEVGGER